MEVRGNTRVEAGRGAAGSTKISICYCKRLREVLSAIAVTHLQKELSYSQVDRL